MVQGERRQTRPTVYFFHVKNLNVDAELFSDSSGAQGIASVIPASLEMLRKGILRPSEKHEVPAFETSE